MSAASRRRRQHAIGFRNIARIGSHKNQGRPIYRRRALSSVAEAIRREREFAKRQAQIKRKS